MNKNMVKAELKELVEEAKLKATIRITNQLLKASIKMNGYSEKKLAKRELKKRFEQIDKDAEEAYEMLKF